MSNLELERRIEGLLYRRIRKVDQALRASGYRVRIGFEDEVYVAGPRAHVFLVERSAALIRLRSAFPEVGRVYREADMVSLRGTPLRLGVPRVRKWEITTRHVDADGREMAPARQARLLTAIREFMVNETARSGHVAHYGARPVRDVRDLIGPPGHFRVSECELLTSLRREVHSTRFVHAVSAQFRHRASDAAFGDLRQALPDLPAADIADLVREMVYHDVDDRVIRRAGRALGCRLRRRIARAWQEWAAAAARIVSGIEHAVSLAGLCREPDGLIDPEAVPACGVDVNVSLVRDGRNVFHDPRAHDQASALFHSVGRASVACLGKNSGSLLPLAQSYSPETFERLFRADLHVPDRASVGPKSAGASCKQSPDSIATNPSRAVEHGFDRLGEDTIRLEVRAGEAGGGEGTSNALSAPHAVLLMLIAAQIGIDSYRSASSPLTPLRDPHPAEQPLNVSHDDALSSFERSVVLRDGYGGTLHRLVVMHARRVLHELVVSSHAMQRAS